MDALHLFEILRECMEATRDLVAACAVEVRAGLRPPSYTSKEAMIETGRAAALANAALPADRRKLVLRTVAWALLTVREIDIEAAARAAAGAPVEVSHG